MIIEVFKNQILIIIIFKGPTLVILQSNEEPKSFFGGMAVSSWKSFDANDWVNDPVD